MNRNLIALLFLAFTVLASCTGSRNETGPDKDDNIKYAELLNIHRTDSFTLVEIRNPWNTKQMLHRYILVPKEQHMPHGLPKGDIVRTPVSTTAVFSSVHCGLMQDLGEIHSIIGVCDAQYIYIQAIQQALLDNDICDFGSSMAPNMEKIMEHHPEAIFLSPYENSGSYGKLGKLGITLIECADYMETTPLGRAEWIKFYGMLTGKEATADSIFNAVEERYNDIKALAEKTKTRPTVVTEMKNGSTWYIAGNRSTVGRLIADAGGKYIFSDINTAGAQPFSPEKAFVRAQKADIWLIKYSKDNDMTKRELAQEWPSNKYMKAYTANNVYGCNLSYARIFEDTPFHPDILLAEYVNIFHPGLINDYNKGGTQYFKKLSE